MQAGCTAGTRCFGTPEECSSRTSEASCTSHGCDWLPASCRVFELKHACFRAYNAWLAEYCATAPNRLFGVGQIAMHDPVAAIADLEELRRLGMRGVMLPVTAVALLESITLLAASARNVRVRLVEGLKATDRRWFAALGSHCSCVGVVWPWQVVQALRGPSCTDAGVTSCGRWQSPQAGAARLPSRSRIAWTLPS